MPIPVIFDTDAGTDIDDIWALALILAHPNLDLLGVTTVTGDTQARARLVAKMLRLAGRADVPVLAGMGVPFVYGAQPQPAAAGGPTDKSPNGAGDAGTQEEGRAGIRRAVGTPGAARLREAAPEKRAASPPDAPRPHGGRLTHTDIVTSDDPEFGARYEDAVQFMLDILKSAERSVTIIGTGPWTNIAHLVSRADERIASAVECLALMGGEVHLMHSEANVKHDPEAARVLFESHIPIFDATWSVSRQLVFPIGEVDELCGGSTSPFMTALHEGTRMWWSGGQTMKPGPVCYDVIPVFWAAGDRSDISCIKLEEIPVELDGTHTRGMTVCRPWRIMTAEKTDRTSADYITVTDSMDAAALKKRYVQLVFGGP